MQLLGPRICELIDRVERRAFEVAAIGDAKLLEGADRRDRREARIIFRACDIAFGLAVEIGIERPVTLVAARISDRNAPGPAEKHGEGIGRRRDAGQRTGTSEEPTAEHPSLLRISYAVFCLKKIHIVTA